MEADQPALNPLAELLGGPWTPAKKMSKEELVAWVEAYRTLVLTMPEPLKYYLSHVGDTVRLIKRDYKDYLGIFMCPDFDPSWFSMLVYEKRHDPSSGVYFWESKTIRVVASSVFNFEFISERHRQEEVDHEAVGEYSLQPLDQPAM